MKKFLSVLFLVTLCVVGFSKTTIVHWMHHSPARLEFVDKMAKQFMEENPDVEIVIQSIPLSEYKTKLLAAVAAGSGPDVAQIRGEAMLELYYYQVIQPFPKTVLSVEKVKEDYIEPTVRNLIIDGELYGLPTDVQTIVLFYNPVLFEQAGLDPNRPPEDWNELIEYAKKLTKWEEGKMVQSGWAFEGYDRELETMMRCAGATFWEDEKQTKVKLEPAIIETYEFYKKAIEEHKVYTPEFGSRWTGFRQIKEGMVFGHGAMVGSFMVGSHPDLVFRTAPVPKHPETGKRVTVLTSWSLSIMEGCKDPEVAAKWLLYITSEDAQRKWLEETGELPSLKVVANDPKYINDPLLGAVVDSLNYAEPTFSKGWANPSAMLRDAYNDIIKKGVPVEEAASKAIKEINKYLEETFGQFE